MKQPPKPRHKIGDTIIGRTDHLGDNMPNELVMVEIESARYDSRYAHWIYCGTVWHKELEGVNVEIYDYDVTDRFRK